ncbi:MAG TPA: hypothetical protein VMV69_28605 [Pirellulales bacterium]|nr:hypothetical protein [Pirellulales bacterium]
MSSTHRHRRRHADDDAPKGYIGRRGSIELPARQVTLTLTEAAARAGVSAVSIAGFCGEGWQLPSTTDLPDGRRGWQGDDVDVVLAWCHRISHPTRQHSASEH